MKIDKGRIINDFIEPNKRQYAIPVKQKELDDVKTKVVVLYSDVKGRTVWNAEAIELRADRLADIIVKLYPIEQPA